MIDKILLIPSDAKLLEPNLAGFLPPQACLMNHGKKDSSWVKYVSSLKLKEPKLHTFGLVFAWDGKPCYAGLDFFWRNYTDEPFSWPINWNWEDRSLKYIVSKYHILNRESKPYGEIIIIDKVGKELAWPSLEPKHV